MTFFFKNLQNAGPGHGIALPYPFRGETVLFEDFVTVDRTEFNATADTAKYDVIGTNGVATLFAASDTIAGGALVVTTAGASGDDTGFQQNGAPFKFEQGTALTFSARLSLSALATSTVWFGLSEEDAADPQDTQDEGIGFNVLNGLVRYESMYVTGAGTITNTPASTGFTMGAATMARFDIYWDGVSTITWSINGVQVGSQTVVGTLTADFLAPCFIVSQTAGSITRAITIDYFYVAQECVAAGR